MGAKETIENAKAWNPFSGTVGFCTATPSPPGCDRCGWRGLPRTAPDPWRQHTSTFGTWWLNPKGRWWATRPYRLPTHRRKGGDVQDRR